MIHLDLLNYQSLAHFIGLVESHTKHSQQWKKMMYPTMIRSVWCKNFEKFSNRPHTPSMEMLSGNYKNLSISDYPQWKKNRANVAQAFTKTKLKQNARDVIDRNTSYLINRLKEFEATKQPFYPEIYFKKFAFNIILNMGFSVEIPYDEAVGEGILAELVEPIDDIVMAAAAGNIFDYFHLLSPIYLAYKRITGSPVDSIINVVRRIHSEHLNSIDREKPRDIMDQMIIAFPEESDVMTILSISLDLFAAVAYTYYNYRLINNPEIQEKAYAELVEVVGKGKTATVEHRINTPYMHACIKEVLRFTPIVSLGLPRTASEDSMVGNIFVPKGTQVMHNLYALHHDKSYWVEPERFMPERFLGNNHTDHYLPFSIGQRDCVGKNLGEDELYAASANMVLNFKFASSTGQPIDETERFGITIGPLVKYSVILEARV
eukprot:gene12899-15152_t